MEKFDIDVTIDDEGLEDIAIEYKNICYLLESMMSTYLEVMSDVCENSIQSGNVHNNLVSYYSTVKRLSGQIHNIGLYLEKQTNSFLEEIDYSDGKIYD